MTSPSPSGAGAAEALAPVGVIYGRAVIRDASRRVTYYVTLDETGGSPTISALEIVPDAGATHPRAFLPPVARLTALAVDALLDERSCLDVPGGGDQAPPTSEALAHLVAAGWSRARIARVYGRSVGAVDQWLRRARQELPESFPARRRGPAPSISGGLGGSVARS